MVALGERPQDDVEWAGRARMAAGRLAAQPEARERLAAAELALAAARAQRGERRGDHWSSQELAWDAYYRALSWRDLLASKARSLELDDLDREALAAFPQS